MGTVWEWLKGKKTYFLMAGAAIYAVLISLGILPSEQIVWQLIGASTVAALRDALPKP